ncbi:Ribokinase-like protein [Sordaria brevicollis]|uniref:Ribokinase-like protein n=1 Tax=Sordaria brevicollis TaxID=83679 RepID=A0AAE0UGP3_SORBR|nr:Ribokinase-like protein [Sordaria brevicollis]
MKGLILVGACYLDTILTSVLTLKMPRLACSVPQFPEEDSKLRATALQVRRGGNCPNTAEVLQQLLSSKNVTAVTPPLSQQQEQTQEERRRRLKLHLVSVLPRVGSSATKTIESSFEPPAACSQSLSRVVTPDTRVDLCNCLYRDQHDEAASSYIIRSEATGSRTIVNYSALPEMTTSEFVEIVHDIVRARGNQDEFGGDCWWHFEGRIPETTLQCIRYLRKVLPDSIVSVEVEKPGRLGLVELAAEADVVFYSKSWAESRGYTGPIACLRGEMINCKAASLMFCTWGPQGAAALSMSRDDHDSEKQRSPVTGFKEYDCLPSEVSQTKTITAVDTIGAGDTFLAGVLYDLLMTLPSPEVPGKGFRNRAFNRPRPSSDGTTAANPTMCRKATKDILRFAVGLATKKVQIEGFAGLVP